MNDSVTSDHLDYPDPLDRLPLAAQGFLIPAHDMLCSRLGRISHDNPDLFTRPFCYSPGHLYIPPYIFMVGYSGRQL